MNMVAPRHVRTTSRIYGRLNVKPEEPLPDGANPMGCDELKLSQVDRSRKVYCAHQTACCTHAASQGWSSYHCRGCEIEEPLTVDSHRRDIDGLAMLLAAIQMYLDPS